MRELHRPASEIHEIRVTSLGGDPLGEDVQREADRTLGLSGIEAIRTGILIKNRGAWQQEEWLSFEPA